MLRIDDNYVQTSHYSFFADCIGALDGTHIDVSVHGEPAAPRRNRKGRLSQIVQGAVDFDMRFVYALAA